MSDTVMLSRVSSARVELERRLPPSVPELVQGLLLVTEQSLDELGHEIGNDTSESATKGIGSPQRPFWGAFPWPSKAVPEARQLPTKGVS